MNTYLRYIPSASRARFSNIHVHLQVFALLTKPRRIWRSSSAGHFPNATLIASAWRVSLSSVRLYMFSQPTRRNPTQEDPKSTPYFGHPSFADQSISIAFHRPRGPSFLPSCSGCTVLITVSTCPTPPLKTRSSRRKRFQRGNAHERPAIVGRRKGCCIAITAPGRSIKVCGQRGCHIIPSFDPCLCSSILQQWFNFTRFA